MFANLPNDLTLPPGGALTPGSGTIYIGSGNLPTLLTPYPGALVFYSDAGGFAGNIEYFYIVYTQNGIELGCHVVGAPALLRLHNWKYNSTDPTYKSRIEHNEAQLFSVDNHLITNGAILLNTKNNMNLAVTAGPFALTVSTETDFYGPKILIASTSAAPTDYVEIHNMGTRPVIKAMNSSIVDKWQSGTSVQSCNGTNCNVSWEWRVTMDGWVDLRYKIEPVAGTVATGGFMVTFTTLTATYQPNGSDPLALILREITRVAGGTNGFAPNALIGNVLNIDNTGVTAGANCTGFYGQFAYSTDKA